MCSPSGSLGNRGTERKIVPQSCTPRSQPGSQSAASDSGLRLLRLNRKPGRWLTMKLLIFLRWAPLYFLNPVKTALWMFLV